jgi:hypothetical protein
MLNVEAEEKTFGVAPHKADALLDNPPLQRFNPLTRLIPHSVFGVFLLFGWALGVERLCSLCFVPVTPEPSNPNPASAPPRSRKLSE